MPRKLYIYDKSGFQDRWQANGRFRSDDDDIVTLAVGSKQDALDGLDRLLSKGMVFDRMLIQSHGDHGLIWMGENQIIDSDWKNDFGPGNYDKLFPAYARIYFDGCDVAEGGLGVEFLRGAGRVFLKGMGGEVNGWTSLGLGLPGWIPFLGDIRSTPPVTSSGSSSPPGTTTGRSSTSPPKWCCPIRGRDRSPPARGRLECGSRCRAALRRQTPKVDGPIYRSWD
jgi:hypothetical protein